MTQTTFILANFVNTTLAAPSLSGSTSMTLTSSANLPTLSSGQQMPLTLQDAATGLINEIVYVTGIAGAVLTVARAQEGTTAQNWNIGDSAACTPTANTVLPAIQWQAAGIPSGVVNGSNKTYALPNIPIGSVPVYINSGWLVQGTLSVPKDFYIDSSGNIITTVAYGGISGTTDVLSFGEYRY